MKIRRTKFLIRKCIYRLIALICVIGIGFSGYKICVWLTESQQTKETSAELVAAANITEVEDDERTEKVETEEQSDKKTSLYWQYINTNLIDVDIDALTSQNSDTAGWVQVLGTNINYPFVQTTNNDFYLSHSFYKNQSTAGWVFADFRNRFDGSDKNIILYAHGRYDATMFGTLRNILMSGWLSDTNNYVVRTVDATESSLWQVFSVYKIKTTNDYIQTDFANDSEFASFANTLISRSQHDFQTSVSGSDRILTLSTCYSSTERVVLHAKLIKYATL